MEARKLGFLVREIFGSSERNGCVLKSFIGKEKKIRFCETWNV